MPGVAARRPHYEDVPVDALSAISLREFRAERFPFDWHYHPEVELTLVVRGEGTRFVGDSVEEFSDGDVCLVGANTAHCWASDKLASPGVVSRSVLFLPGAWGTAFWNLPELRAVRDLLEQAQRGLAVQGTARKEVEQLFQAMQQQPHGSLQRLDTLLQMLQCVAHGADCQLLAAEAYRPSPGAGVNGKLGRILGYIHAQLGPELTQHEVAEAVRLTPQAFSQFFRRNLGTSYVCYVNELKVRAACRALLETDQSITEIAFSAGFNNLSHFNAQFRRLRHLTPREFRRRAQAPDPGAAEAVPSETEATGRRLRGRLATAIRGDLTLHGRATQLDGVRMGTEYPRPWLKRHAVCPALARHQILHAGIVKASAPYQIVRANQSSCYFLACFGGRGRVLVDGRWRLIRPGLACLLPAHVHHAFEAVAGEPWRFAYVCYQEPRETQLLASASSPVVREFEPQPLRLVIEGLTAECRHEAHPARVDHWLELMHGYVLSFTCLSPGDSQLPALWEEVAMRLGENWTVESLAKAAGSAPALLQRSCHKELGRSPLQHLTHLRLRRAAELLITTELQLAAIAESVGYRHLSVFSRAFKAQAGCRPSLYRQHASPRPAIRSS